MKYIIILIAILHLCNSCFYDSMRYKSDTDAMCIDTVFNSDIWKNLSNNRRRMVNNLMSSGILNNINKDSVIKILGTPKADGEFGLDYIIMPQCETNNLLILYIEVDSSSKKVTDYWMTD